MAEVAILNRGTKKPDIYCYDDVTDKDEVFDTLRDLVKTHKMAKNIYVISGTHGSSNGTVDATDKDVSFKKEDLDSAKITSSNINIRDYHQTAPNRWKELSQKPGATNIIVLAFCYSRQWFENNGVGGNDGKL
jgi:hypothetical protein